MNFRQLVEGSNPKYKAGDQPKFTDAGKQVIADAIVKFLNKNKGFFRDIHFPSETELKGTYDNSNKFTLAITSKEAVEALFDYFRNDEKFEASEMGKNTEFTVNGVFLIRQSSGRGFFYQDESKQKNPKTDQQETGTIKFLQYYIANAKYPSNQEINQLAKFDFDQSWYNSFIYQADAIIEFCGLNGSFTIELDSAAGKIGKKIFKLLSSLKGTEHIEKDNWNPADIWIYKNEATVLQTLKAATNIVEFNAAIKQLFITKDLIGVSLKKQDNAKAGKVIEASKEKPFDLNWGSSSINAGVNHCDIMTKGYPKGFFIRSRAKAKSITSEKDIKIYFEGKVENSKVFLGAIDKKLITTLTGYDGKPPKTVTFEDVEALFGTLAKRGNKINKTALKDLKKADEMRLKYMFVLYTYIDKIQALPSDTLNKIGMAGYKMNDYSSIHLKVGA